LFAAIAAMSACGDAQVAGGAAGGSSGSGGGRGGGGGGSGSTDGPVFEVSAPETPPGGGALDSGTGAVCAETSVTAQRTPVDLLLLIDASDSMAAPGTGTTQSKYQLVRQALLRFARDPASAGLGIGVQFFPLPGPGSSCQSDLDCGFVNPPTTPPCAPVTACADSVAAGQTRECRGGCGGSTCVALGRCTRSLLDCTNIGQACPGGMAGDTCTGFGKSCGVVDGLAGCAETLYQQPFVPIAQLPSPGERLVSWGLAVRYPSGGTPLRPAVAGAMTGFRRHLGQNTGRKGVMVLASDGAPSPGCTNNTVAATATVLSDARMPGGLPAVDTYVVGVYTPADAAERMALETLATAGGTGMPLVIAPNEDLNQRFFETLNRIRGQSLPCELLIPPPLPGAGPLDLGRVNLRFRGASGEEDVLYTGSAARCDPMRGGWYYDADPATGGTPTRIIVCEATCKKWKGDAMASVDLRVGCRTRVID
jgi:hypothetical protein